MKDQETIKNRSAITVAHKFCWHKKYEAGLNILCELNTGECNLIGKTSGELIWHFIAGSDEICMHAPSIHLNDIGYTDQKKHENILHNFHCSITIYCTGLVAGNTGPTIFLMVLERI